MGNIIGKVIFDANQAINNGLGLHRPSSEEVLRKAIFANGPALPKISSALSGHSMGSAYAISSYTSLYRATQDLAVGIWSQFPNSPFSWLKDFIGSKDIALGYHAFGSATSINIISGIVQMVSDLKALAYSDAIEDKRGSLIGRVSVGKDAALAGAGFSFGVYRPISMAQVITDAPSSSLLGRISNGFTMAGLAFYAVFFVFLSAIFGIRLHEGVKMKGKLDKAEDLLGQIKVLQKKLVARPERVQEKLIAKHGSEKARELLVEEALEAGEEGLKSMMKELGIENVPTKALKGIVKQAIESGCKGWTQGAIAAQVEEKLMQVGLQMKIQKAQIKKTGKAQRCLGKIGFEAIKELSSLSGRVQLGDKEATRQAEKLVKVIQSSNRKKMIENALVFAISTLGIVAMITGIVMTSGLPLVVASAIMFVFSILMMGVDGFYLLESYKEERPAPHDKKMLVASTIIGIASLLALIALGASGVVTMGIFPIVIAAIFSVIWIGQNGVTWAVMNRNERKYHEKNPTLESFLEVLEDEKQREMIMKIFANLPEEFKVKIQEELKNHQNDMRLSTLAVIEKVEQAKKKQMELLRLSLTPHIVTDTAG